MSAIDLANGLASDQAFQAFYNQNFNLTAVRAFQVLAASSIALENVYTIKNDCAEWIRVTKYLVVTGCPSYANGTGRISVYQRDVSLTATTLQLLSSIDGPYLGARLGQGT